jgi:dihydrofolate reductase
VTSTLSSADWNNSTILGPYDPEAIQELKDGIGGKIYVSGSAKLVRAMLADGLVDELHLFVYPLTLGAGQRLFPDDNPETRFALRAADAFDNQVVHLAYGPAE